jgi:hypothetical protein
VANNTDLVEALKTPPPSQLKDKVPSRLGVGHVEAPQDSARFPQEGNIQEVSPSGVIAGAPPLLPLPGSNRGPVHAPVAVNPAALRYLNNLRLTEPSTNFLYEVANDVKISIALRGGKRADIYPGDRIDFAAHKEGYKTELERGGVKFTYLGRGKDPMPPKIGAKIDRRAKLEEIDEE